MESSIVSLKVMDPGTNHNIYDKRLTANYPPDGFEYIPHYLYFYYIRLEPNGKLTVDHYNYYDGPSPGISHPYAAIPHAAVPSLVNYLAGRARPGGGGVADGHDFKGIHWTHRSYIALVIDQPGWLFHRKADGRAAVRFNLLKGSTPNHTFFDAVDLDVSVLNPATGQLDQRSGVYFVNHMRSNSDGAEIGSAGQPTSQWFAFDLYFQLKYMTGSGEEMTVIMDPGGTNDGPPEQPPPVDGEPEGDPEPGDNPGPEESAPSSDFEE